MIKPLLRALVNGALLVPLVGLIVLLHLALPATSPAALRQPADRDLQSASTPRERLDLAATVFRDAASGTGIRFEVVQRSVVHARPGGPLIRIPDPDDRYRYLGYADRLYVGSVIADGTVSGTGFHLAMRAGPLAEEAAPNFRGELMMAALVRDGRTWRNDGEGWYLTDDPPGIGLDTTTVALLPRLLRQATGAVEEGTRSVDGRSADVIRATGRVADAPGLLAIDGAPFTELREPISFALDEHGRLVELVAVMRNTNLDEFDLIVTTTITLRYGDAPALPQPVPTAPPPATPAPESEAGG